MLEEDSVSSIQAMLHRETKTYAIPDYFNDSELVLAPRHRRKIAEWCLYLAGYVGFRQASVEMAMNCLDRFASTKAGPVILGNKTLFERATLAALYMIIKCNEEDMISPEDIERISRGKHSKEEITAMERVMLMELDWNVNPPSAMSYILSFLEIIQTTEETKALLTEVASSQVEFAIQDYSISRKGPFAIAYAAMLNALELVDVDEKSCSRFNSMIAPCVTASKENQLRLRKDLLDGVPDELIWDESSAHDDEESNSKQDGHESPRSAMDRALPVRYALTAGPGTSVGI